jgi:lysyl-tRNA synthetase class 2
MREAIIKWWPEELGDAPSVEDFTSRDVFGAVLSRAAEHLGQRLEIEVTNDPEDDSASEPNEEDIEPAGPAWWEKGPHQKQKTLFASLGFRFTNNEPLGKLIADLFEAVAEPHLIQPTIIYEFPLAVSPLSKQKPDEPDWVERFEFYIGGFELGNAFSELNDPEEQLRRFQDQMAQHERGDQEAHQMDLDYVRALAYGLPPTGGEGIGIDRLTMILTGARSIRDVILFPLLRPQSQQPAEEEQ